MPERDGGSFAAAAYGGAGWSPRVQRHRDEIGRVWSACGVDSEWAPLRAVLLHRPGGELAEVADPDAAQMLGPLDPTRAAAQHDGIAAAYRSAGVAVHELAPRQPRPNQMFCADLVFMTPEGAILARPASTVRAGEEREMARRLTDLGVPILRSLTGAATFEGADALWLDRKTVLLGRGLRSNDAGLAQVTATLAEIGVASLVCDLPYGSMHLMGLLRIFDRDLAVAWPRRTPHAAVAALRDRGVRVVFLPEEAGQDQATAFNAVTLGPRRILVIPAHAATMDLYAAEGVDCVTVEGDELAKAAGAIGCLSAVLRRDPA